MIHPSSELETSRWIAGESSLCEILSLQKAPDHRQLYKAARALYGEKENVEDFLYQHFSSKHPVRMRLCLYDLTNFYFESRKEHSTLAQFGRSKEKRNDAKLKVDEHKTVTDILYQQSKPDKEADVYFIRCSQKHLTEELIWEIYNILREIESTFRCLKTDLDIRPIHHQFDENTVAHIFLGIVAYQLVHAIRQTLKDEGINHSWRRIRNIMSSQTCATTRMKLENRDSLILRNMTRPNMEQTKIYRALNFKQTNPKMRKIAVVPHK